jgi:hypothetical protein
MPHLQSGVAERLHGRIVCLDASPERVALTPALADQVQIDVLAVRAEVLGLLREVDERGGAHLLSRCPSLIVAIDGDAPRVECGRTRAISSTSSRRSCSLRMPALPPFPPAPRRLPQDGDREEPASALDQVSAPRERRPAAIGEVRSDPRTASCVWRARPGLKVLE